MEKKIRRCCVCGKEYEYCNKCREDINKPLWYFTFCSDNCHDIYGVTSQFENGNVDAFTAKSNLEKLDLSKQNNFGKSYKNTITKIFNSVPKLKEIVEMSETTEQDIKSIEQPDQESLENNAVISDTVLEEENKLEEEKSIVKKSRKKKKNVE